MTKQISENKEYYNMLFEFSKVWIKKQMKPFTSDDLKIEYFKKNKKPNNANVFGNVFNALQKKGLIKDNNAFVKSKFKEAHGRMIKQWISKEYSELQSKKRLSEETAKARELAKNQTNLF